MKTKLCLPAPLRRVRYAALTVCLISLMCPCNSALAALGTSFTGSAPASTTTTAAATRLSASTSSTSSLYITRNNTLESGTVVTEYATPAGLVFAVAWQGPTLPDLSALLGTYFPTFKQTADASRTSRNVGTPLRIDTGGLVAVSSGRMRNFSGHAYATGLIPSGVNILDILP
jgi:hypothetical protein